MKSMKDRLLRKRVRFLAALLLAALTVFTGAPALAAVNPAAAPNLTLVGPADGMNSGSFATLTVTTDLPGFMTVQLLDASKNTVATFCRNYELHTKENAVSITAVDGDGKPIAPGSYLLSAVVVSQFGVSSAAVTVPLNILIPPSVDDPEDFDPNAATAAGTATAAASSGSSSAPKPAGNGASGSSAKAPTPKPASNTTTSTVVTYGAGVSAVGDEGLQVGVGVSDVADQKDAGYWALTADASDADIWAAITRDMVCVNVDEKESAYLYDSVGKGQKRLGTLSGTSQGLNVITERDDGWTLVEAYRNEDGAFVRGYIRSNRLKTVDPNQTYGIVVDKKAQKLYVYKDGKRVGSCDVSTGLPTPAKLNRETPAGEFITVTRRGTTEMTNLGFCEYTIRINGNFHLCEMPSTKRKGKDFSPIELGKKGTRGNIAIAHEASSDGGINAEWIWDMTDTNKRVKVLVFDDKARTEVPIGK